HTVSDPLTSFCDLLGRQRVLLCERAASLGQLDTLSLSLLDRRTIHLSDSGKDRQHELADCRVHAHLGVVGELYSDTLIAEFLHDVEQVARGSCKPVYRLDFDRVALADFPHKLGETGAASAVFTARLVGDHLVDFSDGFELPVEVLLTGADSGVAECVAAHVLSRFNCLYVKQHDELDTTVHRLSSGGGWTRNSWTDYRVDLAKSERLARVLDWTVSVTTTIGLMESLSTCVESSICWRGSHRILREGMVMEDKAWLGYSEHHPDECGCSVAAGRLLTVDGVEPLAVIGEAGSTLCHTVEVLARLDPEARVLLGGGLGAVDLEETTAGCLLEHLGHLALLEPERVLDAEVYAEALALYLGTACLDLGVPR